MHYSASYLVLSAWGATPGQAEIRQASLAEAAGRVYPTADPEAGFTGCFECHSTGPVAFDDKGGARSPLQSMSRGGRSTLHDLIGSAFLRAGPS
jgi:hypothetical protein